MTQWQQVTVVGHWEMSVVTQHVYGNTRLILNSSPFWKKIFPDKLEIGATFWVQLSVFGEVVSISSTTPDGMAE
ncbi:hypothetical protein COY32_06635 [candidate division WWE3 bacterium CG_4_10_14_0_2_um_filter_41_14]|uniref:Uncharacterized protein n=1 Tax=candidate division WWE3 bacterium CG_4_10_14_0_2_um_filter_41_14 TaxID=1975072 RepID=A0A2M7TF41_UNCKA|nr:MAG: hypothetical protein COY32_06635 [candidate division WWE3 bacterium CG_4_10_14_0_2_um_filter_41_14]